MQKNITKKSGIPEEAKKVFEGNVFDVFQWPQKMYDGTMQTFEKLKRADTVEILAVTEDMKIMLLDEEQPNKGKFVSLPGGRVERNEDLLEAIERELLEETGYIAKEIELFHTVSPVSKIDWTIYTYIGRHCRKIADQLLDGGEKISIRFVTFDELIDEARKENFFHKDLSGMVLQALLDEEKMKILKKKIIGK